MKKRTIVLLLSAILLIVIGTIGATINYQRLENEREKTAVNKKVAYDGAEELVLNFKNSANVAITNSTDNYIYMKKSGISLSDSRKKQTNWAIKQEKTKTIVTINNQLINKKHPSAFIQLGSISDDTIYLQLPQDYKKITINGKSVSLHIYDIALDKLAVDVKNGNTNISNYKGETLDVSSKRGDISISDVKLQKNLTALTNSGFVEVINGVAENISVESENGDVMTGNTKGNLTITNTNGQTSINHTVGKVKIDNQSNDITYHDNKATDDVTLTSTHGNIYFEIDDATIENNQFDLSTKFGIIQLLDEDISSDTSNTIYKTDRKKAPATITAQTKNGDITINEIDDDDSHYGYD